MRTTNAAALTTRLAASVVDVVEALQQENPDSIFGRLPPALVTKAVVVHTATWNRDAYDALSAVLRTKDNASNLKDIASAFLGYGRIDPDRARTCTEQRATFLSGGFIRPDQQWVHRIPIPSCLHSQTCWRRLTITLAWFTPIAPRSRLYRGLSVSFTPPKGDSFLRVSRQDVHGNAVSRGTVQHEVLEIGMQSVMIYMLVYLVMNLGAFLVVIVVAQATGSESIDDYRGLARRHPLSAITFAVFLFSLTGLPPFAGFTGKWYLFVAVLQNVPTDRGPARPAGRRQGLRD